MVIHCIHCGEVLPGKNARFCRHCGMLVPSHPLSFQSLTAPKGATPLPPSSVPMQPTGNKPILQEHVADQSPSHPSQRIERDEPTSSSNKVAPEARSADQPEKTIAAMTAIQEELDVKELLAEQMVISLSEPSLGEDDVVDELPTLPLVTPDYNGINEQTPNREQHKQDEHREEIELHDTMALSVLQEQQMSIVKR